MQLMENQSNYDHKTDTLMRHLPNTNQKNDVKLQLDALFEKLHYATHQNEQPQILQ